MLMLQMLMLRSHGVGWGDLKLRVSHHVPHCMLLLMMMKMMLIYNVDDDDYCQTSLRQWTTQQLFLHMGSRDWLDGWVGPLADKASEC